LQCPASGKDLITSKTPLAYANRPLSDSVYRTHFKKTLWPNFTIVLCEWKNEKDSHGLFTTSVTSLNEDPTDANDMISLIQQDLHGYPLERNQFYSTTTGDLLISHSMTAV
jgi:hypothetical protein